MICSDYASIQEQMLDYDTIQSGHHLIFLEYNSFDRLPLINETKQRSLLERRLRLESALMEYGSLEWMQWIARRLSYHNYSEELSLPWTI